MSDTKRTREEWIVLRCQLGDLAAYKELVELMEKRLFYYIRRFIRNETDAYDVLQEVWLAVFLKIRQLRETKAFRPWIYRIAHDKAVSQIRQEISQAKVQEDVAEQISSQDEEPAWNPEQIARIHKTLGKINPLYREVLTLYFLEEMKYEEIAHVVGCSVGSVKSRIHYAKEDLRRLMEAKNDD